MLNSHRGVDIFNYLPPFIKMWQYSIILVLLLIIAVKLDSLFKWKYIQKGGKKFFICITAIILVSILLFNIELLSYSIIHRVILPLTWTYFYLYVLEDILLQDAKKKNEELQEKKDLKRLLYEAEDKIEQQYQMITDIQSEDDSKYFNVFNRKIERYIRQTKHSMLLQYKDISYKKDLEEVQDLLEKYINRIIQHNMYQYTEFYKDIKPQLNDKIQELLQISNGELNQSIITDCNNLIEQILDLFEFDGDRKLFLL